MSVNMFNDGSDFTDRNEDLSKEHLLLYAEPFCFTLFEDGDFVGNSFLANHHIWTAQHVAEEFENSDFSETQMRDIAKSQSVNTSRGFAIASVLNNKDVLSICSKSPEGEIYAGQAIATIINKKIIRLTGVFVEFGQSGSPILNSKLEAVGILTNMIGAEDNSIFTPFSDVKLIRSKL